MFDLLGDALPVVRKHARPEAAALQEVLKALTAHPAVAWCERLNSGAVRIGKRFVRFGLQGRDAGAWVGRGRVNLGRSGSDRPRPAFKKTLMRKFVRCVTKTPK